MSGPTAASVEMALRALSSPDQRADVARFFFDGLGEIQVLGVGIGKVFPVAKAHRTLTLPEIERLLDGPFYEVRMVAAAIMDFQARDNKAVNSLADLYDLYMRRHDRLNNWDFVDRAAAHVVGQYLADKDRTPLYELAQSPEPWRRRTAIVATYYFIRAGSVEDTFAICALLADDPHPMVQKAIGSWVRTAGDIDPDKLREFLDATASSLQPATVRAATAKLPEDAQRKYRKLART